MEFNQELCDQKHSATKDNFDRVDARLNNHGSRIDVLEQGTAVTNTKLDNVCDQIKDLVLTMKSFILVLITGLIGFVFWYIQSL